MGATLNYLLNLICKLIVHCRVIPYHTWCWRALIITRVLATAEFHLVAHTSYIRVVSQPQWARHNQQLELASYVQPD